MAKLFSPEGMRCRRGNREKVESSNPISAPTKLPKWTDSLADDPILASFLEMVFSTLTSREPEANVHEDRESMSPLDHSKHIAFMYFSREMVTSDAQGV